MKLNDVKLAVQALGAQYESFGSALVSDRALRVLPRVQAWTNVNHVGTFTFLTDLIA